MALQTDTIRFVQPADVLCWFLALALGFLAAASPQLFLERTADPGTRTIFVNGALLVVGLVMGALKPDGPWRWGVACILALPLADLAGLGALRVGEASASRLAASLLDSTPIYFARFIPAGAGSYLGSYLVSRRM